MRTNTATLILNQHVAMIAHLDAIEARVTGLLLDVRRDITLIRDDIAGIKLELATHGHEENQS